MEYRYRDASEMKDSGVEWIGKIPKDWEIKRNKYMFSEINLKNSKHDDNLLSVSEYYGVALRRDKMSDNEYLTRAESLEDYKVCKEDDLVMNIMLAWKKAMGVSRYDGIVSPAYCIYRKKDIISMKYYHYLFRTDLYASLFKQNSTGIIDSRLRLYPEKFLSIYSHRPKLETQMKIAKFLDKKTSQFDSIISKKEALIEKLEEAKKSLISEVVTGKLKVVKTDDGYDLVKRSSDEMKDSGVDWIGCIPKGFKIVRLGLISFVTKLAGFEYTNNMAEALSNEGEVPIVRAGNIKMNKFINQEKEFIDIETSKLLNRSALYQKCVLITFIGAGIGEVALFDKVERHHLAPNVAKIEILGENKNKIDEQYLIYYLMSSAGQEEVNKIKKASAQPSLSMETIRNMKIVIPELDEQYKINEYLTKRIKEIEHIIDKTKKQIEKLKEAKPSLISVAVTGTIEIMD